MISTVAIVGVGLIGASFALALKKCGFTGRILGVSSEGALRAGLESGAIDEGCSLESAVPRADLIYLSQTIHRIIEVLPALNGLVRPGALVTDAGSTKQTIVSAAGRALTKCQFLGGHPLAGKEQRGAVAADPDLFRNRRYVLTPTGANDLETPAAAEFLEWIKRIGAIPVVITSQEHDRTVALTSHLPQLASTALAAVVAQHIGSDESLRVSGTGLLDMTRLAMSPFDVWHEILATNASSLERALQIYIAKLEQIRQALDQPALRDDFEAASALAQKLRS